jgi:hypothetical protein
LQLEVDRVAGTQRWIKRDDGVIPHLRERIELHDRRERFVSASFMPCGAQAWARVSQAYTARER